MLEAFVDRGRPSFVGVVASWPHAIFLYCLVAAMSIAAFFAPDWGWSCGPSHGSIAAMQVRNFRTAIDLYRQVKGVLPATLVDLTEPDPVQGEPFLVSVLQDPWGRAYRYRILGRHTDRCEVRSAGGDGDFGTADDVVATDGPAR